jgi:hypothetical protein
MNPIDHKALLDLWRLEDMPLCDKGIEAVHRLSYADATRAYPVHLKAVITYYDPFIDGSQRRPLMMATDSTASIYVGLTGPTSLPLKPGLLIDINGVSNPGELAPTSATPPSASSANQASRRTRRASP